MLIACNGDIPTVEELVATRPPEQSGNALATVTAGSGAPITPEPQLTALPTIPVATPEPSQLNLSAELDLAMLGNIPIIDPQRAVDSNAISRNAIDLVENLFIGLTTIDPVTNSIQPELATSWTVSADGTVWSFNLRNDVYWVRDTPNGIIQGRLVTATDVVAAVHRICNSDNQVLGAFNFFIIDGCEVIFGLPEVLEENLGLIQAYAVDDVTFQVTLREPANHFLAMTSMWQMRPVAPELERPPIEFNQDRNAELLEFYQSESFFTTGPYVLQSDSIAEQLKLNKNPFWPLPKQKENANVDSVNIYFADSSATAVTYWDIDQIDILPAIPRSQQETVLANNEIKTVLVPEASVFYLGYNFESPVFRDPAVRRAFGAAIDRQKLIDEVYGGRGIPMRHFTPPGILNAPAIDDIGVGFDPFYAQTQMQESSFANCGLIPQDIVYMVSSTDLALQHAEVVRDMWVDVLDCPENKIVIEQVPFGALLANTRQDGRLRPDIYDLGWKAFYPDAHNWLSDVLHCADSENRQKRPCTPVDGSISQADGLASLESRPELYRRAERSWFDRGGVEPITPLFMSAEYELVQTWLVRESYMPVTFGGDKYDTIQIISDVKALQKEQ